MDNAKLGSFETEGDAPELEILKPVRLRDRITGWIAKEKTEGYNCYVSKRKRSKHLFRKLDAWGVSKALFPLFRTAEVEKVFIHDLETQHVIEYDVEQFFDGKEINYSDPQTVVGECMARKRWSRHGSELVKDSDMY